MKEWFDTLQQREKIILMGGLVILILIVFHESIWSPFQQEITELEQRNHAESDKLLQLEKITSEYQQSIKGASRIQSLDISLFSLIEKTTRAGNLKSKIKSMTPEGTDAITMTLKQAELNQIIRWLVTLSVDYGVRIDSIRIQQSDNVGYADAELKLQRVSG